MNDPQINNLRMLAATIASIALPADNAVWATIPAFLTGATRLSESVDIITGLAPEQGERTTGITLNKTKLATAVARRAAAVAGALHAYASVKENADLEVKTAWTYGSLINLRDQEIADTVGALLTLGESLVEQNAPELADYGVNEGSLDALEAALEAYSAMIVSPQLARARKKAATALIETEFARAAKVVKKQLDKLALSVKETHPATYLRYKAARVILDHTGRVSQDPQDQEDSEPTD